MLSARITKLAVAVLVLTSTATAYADDDCPPGSNQKSEDGFTWCEPTVCSNEAPCKANEVCRPVALCMEVGTLADAGARDGGKRLVVTQRCVAGQQPGDPKTCPQKQTCSEMNRCVAKATAEKLGLLDVPVAAASSAPATGDTKKSSCACDVVGAGRSSLGSGSVGAFGIALSLIALRRRRERRDCRRLHFSK